MKENMIKPKIVKENVKQWRHLLDRMVPVIVTQTDVNVRQSDDQLWTQCFTIIFQVYIAAAWLAWIVEWIVDLTTVVVDLTTNGQKLCSGGFWSRQRSRESNYKLHWFQLNIQVRHLVLSSNPQHFLFMFSFSFWCLWFWANIQMCDIPCC